MILRKLANSRFSEVLPEWPGQTCVLIAGGPSLTQEQVATVKAAHVAGAVRCITVNNSYLWAPFSDICYAADAHWHEAHSAGIAIPELMLRAQDVRDIWRGFKGEKCTIDHPGASVKDQRVHVLRNFNYDPARKQNKVHGYGLSRDLRCLVTGRHSGWQAINLAILAGAMTLILLGYDGQAGPRGQSHWHGDHPKRKMPEAAYDEFKRSFVHGQHALDAAGVQVVNCSPNSAINQFPKIPIEKALERCIGCAAEVA